MKSVIKKVLLSILVGLIQAGCSTQLPRSTQAPIYTQPARQTFTTTTRPTATPAILPAQPTGQPGIEEQWQQALQSAQARLVSSLQGPALQQAEQNLQSWARTSQDEIEFQKTNGEVELNPDGKKMFAGRSAQWFAALLANLDLFTSAEIKWAGYRERTPDQKATAVEAVRAYAGQDATVTYQKTERFIFDPLRMVEDYLAGDYVYKVDVETGQIADIEPRTDAAFSSDVTGVEDRAKGRQKAEAIIHQLAGQTQLESLSYVENADPGYYRWEDRAASRLPDGQYRSLQVVFAEDGSLFSYLNTFSTD